jgi:hypothetical protein
MMDGKVYKTCDGPPRGISSLSLLAFTPALARQLFTRNSIILLFNDAPYTLPVVDRTHPKSL